MRRVLVAVVLVALPCGRTAAGQVRRSGQPYTSSPPQAYVSADRIPRLERWLKAVDRHEPGESDEAVDEVGSWSIAELRGLWVDVYVLAQLARNPKPAHFVVKTDTQASGVEIRYSSQQLRQLATLACAAGAMLASDLYCLSLKAASSVDEALMTLVTHAAAERSRTGDDNFVMRRAALLHADV